MTPSTTTTLTEFSNTTTPPSPEIMIDMSRHKKHPNALIYEKKIVDLKKEKEGITGHTDPNLPGNQMSHNKI